MVLWYLSKLIIHTALIPVDCQWEEWEVGACTKTCGGGTRIDTRHEKVQAAHGGAECSGLSNTTKACNLHECPGNNA